MGEVKTLRTGFLVFETRIQVVSTARWKRAGSVVFLPAYGGPWGFTVVFFPGRPGAAPHSGHVAPRSRRGSHSLSHLKRPGTPTRLGNMGRKNGS